MTPLRLFPLSLAASAVFCCYSSVSSAAQEPASQVSIPAPQVRIVDRIDENHLVTLKGNTHPMARAEFDRGKVSDDLSMDGLVLVLQRSPEQQAAFDKFTAEQIDPDSPNFHHWLEPEEIGERFGPAQSDIGQIEAWLRSHGLSVASVSADRMTIRFGGTAGQVEEAFHTEVHNLDVKGEMHIANMSDPKIPAALAQVVFGPKALHNFIPRPLHKMGSKVRFNKELGGWQRIQDVSDEKVKGSLTSLHPFFGINDPNNGLVEDVTPYDFATIYNVLPEWNKGIDGAGQTIAIAGTSDIDANDVALFRSTFGLPAIKSFTQVVANGIDPGECAVSPSQPAYCTVDDQVENSLDVEWSGAVAKGASIVLVVSGENAAGTIDTVYDSANYVIQHKTASILNVSYGLCELGEGTAGNQAYNNLWHSAWVAGIAVFVATGDSGSPSCDQGGEDGGNTYPNVNVAEYGVSVSGLASTPYNTAVGGTDFNWGTTASPYWRSSNAANGSNAVGYIPEIVWNDSCVNPIVLPYLQSDANQVGLSKPNDAEEACNFILTYYSDSGDDELNFLVNTDGAGGGESACTTSDGQNPSSCRGGYPRPSWQTGVTGIPSTGNRYLPDVSFFASNGFLGSSLLICVSAEGACSYSATSENTAQEIGGTSAAAPTMAGVMALINQQVGVPQGNPNVELYKLASTQTYASCSAESVKTSSKCYFNDIDTTNNSMPCDYGLIVNGHSPNCQDIHSDPVGTLSNYAATAGFDGATGLGSLNVANVVNAWPVPPLPSVKLSGTSLTFASTGVGTSSSAQTVTLKNIGATALTLNGAGEGISISGTNASSFSQTNTCGASVAMNASCSIKVVFKPTVAGSLTATLSIADNAKGTPQIITLKGAATGIAKMTVSHTGIVFPSTPVNRSSVTFTITVRSTGTENARITAATLAGSTPESFVETNNCVTTLAPGKTCTISVTFKPNASGTRSAEILLTDNVSGSPQKITLSGLGLGPKAEFTTKGLVFPATTVNTTARQGFTLANEGNYVLGTRGGGVFYAITGPGASSFSETNTCGNAVAAGAKCTFTITFKPRVTGPITAAITFTDNSNPSPQTITLTGTGK